MRVPSQQVVTELSMNAMVETFLGHGPVVVYTVVATIAGYREGFDPAFTIVPGFQLNSLYFLRLLPRNRDAQCLDRLARGWHCSAPLVKFGV